MIRRFLFVILFITWFLPIRHVHAALASFPGAEGYGSQTAGGRGGSVYIVSNLNDSGSGSFREAVETKTGPRIVVFAVNGIIQANSIISIKNPYVTIFGQTAPGDGITIKGSPIFIRTHDVIIRGMKMRIGDQAGASGSDRDGITVWGDATHQVHNIIIDHNSIEWAVDENTSVYDISDNINTITFSWNIIAEGLYKSIHPDGIHSMGMLIDTPKGKVSVHHNLFSSNYDRNPALQSGYVELANNVIYNWGIHPTNMYNGDVSGTNSMVNLLGNTYIHTAGSSSWVGLSGIHCEGSPGKAYESGNVGPGGTDWNTTVCTSNLEDVIKSLTPVFTGSGIQPTSATQAYTDVLAEAGSKRDAVDARIVANVKNKTSPVPGKWIIDSQNEVGGWPAYSNSVPPTDADRDGISDSWESNRGGDLLPSAIAPSGYTWIEEYANSLFSTVNPSTVNSTPTSTPAPTPSASITCPPVGSTAGGKATLSVNVNQAGNYKMWVNMKGNGSFSDSLFLQLDDLFCVKVGDLASMPVNTWGWVDYIQGASATKIPSPIIGAGNHTITLFGNAAEPGVAVDRILMTKDTTCVPTGVGDACIGIISTPTPTTSSVAPTATIKPTIVPSATPKPTVLPSSTPTPISTDGPTILTVSLPQAKRNRSYATNIVAGDPSVSDVLGITSGALPAGLSLTSCKSVSSFSGTTGSCSLSGIPTRRGTYVITFTVLDQSGNKGTKELRLSVK